LIDDYTGSFWGDAYLPPVSADPRLQIAAFLPGRCGSR
jgi:hypothetical protein